MKKLLLTVCISFLTACAGKTTYTVRTPDGIAVDVTNTKDYEQYDLKAEKTAEGWSIELKETGVSASNPLKQAQDANGKLLDKILGITPGN